MTTLPAWPSDAKFHFGQPVECAPGYPYRFPGHICGWYRREGGSIGYSVSREGDPGNVENFSERRLQARHG